MKKVHLLLALSTLVIICIVIILVICLRRHSHSTTTLKVVLNGPTVLVGAKDKPNVITVFSPRDPRLTSFYSNEPSEKRAGTQVIHITIRPTV